MALVTFPKLLILDELTNGLDSTGIEEVRETQRYGMTVLLSSHLLSPLFASHYRHVLARSTVRRITG